MTRLNAGPKKAIELPALDTRGWPKDRAKRRMRFIERYVAIPKGVGAGGLMKLQKFQRQIIEKSYAPGIRTSVVSIPRANGKSALAAALSVAELFVGDASAEVLVVASDQRQANIVLRMARRMIELNPELSERCHVYKDKLYVPETDATMLALPADPAALHGWDPSCLIVDELHVVTEEVWEAISSMTGKRPQSLTLAISTPAASSDSVMWRLVEHGRLGGDPAFALTEFAAPDGCATDDREAWLVANPALSCDRPFLAEDGLEAARKTLREPVFRQLRLGQWVTGVESWLPWGAWDACADPGRTVQPGERVVLGFDGSTSGDSTALVGCTIGDKPFVFLEGLWQPNGTSDRVDRMDVDRAVDAAFAKYDVAELSCDPWNWRSEIEQWSLRHGERRVLEFNTGHVAKMAPAVDRTFQFVMGQKLSHDGDGRLASHVAHAVAKPTSSGDVLYKDRKHSPRKIDAAVAMCIAVARSAHHTNKPRRRVVVSR